MTRIAAELIRKRRIRVLKESGYTNGGHNMWVVYLNAPATAGTYYLWAIAYSSGSTVAATYVWPESIPIT